jgi:hypothetical protein
MWGKLYLRVESELHNRCQEQLVALLSADSAPIPVPPVQRHDLSSVLVQGSSGSDIGTTLANAVQALPRELWPAVYGWKLDAEAEAEHGRTVDSAWKARWPPLTA